MSGSTLNYHKTYPNLTWFEAEMLQNVMEIGWRLQEISDHLESQAASSSLETEEHRHQYQVLASTDLTGPPTQQSGNSSPETSSSEATETQGETSDTYSISCSWSSPVSQAGILPLSALRDIMDWSSSHGDLSCEQAEVTLSIRIPKAATPPSGSASSSPAEEVSRASGHAGRCACPPRWKAREDRELGAFRTHEWNHGGSHHANDCPLYLPTPSPTCG